MARKIADCRNFPGVAKCTLTIAGEEEEVVRAATLHAVDFHGHKDSPDLQGQIRGSLKEERVR
jgi:hypothetical protein